MQLNVLVVVQAAVLLGSQFASAQVDCSLYTSCYSCEQDVAGCGWCAATQSCVPGSDAGPTVGTCSAWFYSYCPGCNNRDSSCTYCTAGAGCGWCTTENDAGVNYYCLEGNSTGPFLSSSYTCNGGWTTWNIASQCTTATSAPTQVPPATCSEYTYCYECVNVPGCGWCSTTQTCLPVSNVGGPVPESACPNPDYWWVEVCAGCNDESLCPYCMEIDGCGWCSGSSTCVEGNKTEAFGLCSSGYVGSGLTCPIPVTTPSPGTICGEYSGCASCIQVTGCGWCAESGTCESGTYTGPSAGTCKAWYPTTAVCPDCQSQSSCEGCRVTTNCGWCATGTDGYCAEGNSTAPYPPGACAGRWSAFPDYCPACDGLTSCQSCTTAGQGTCGWCTTLNRCMSGTVNGPAGGSCNDWNWYSDDCPAPPTSNTVGQRGRTTSGKGVPSSHP
jgi:hypothetical protein